ncbi:FxsA family protein [Nocardioides daphniae]|uniref:FxsA family protein n=1 Tax=Nocardioides daphniae TaxID=402297 RepID=A0A4P7UED7_9ACTN|nr:FxsA family protein [Nocardioides daphniae]QCC77309.1 FxsA family protein [Nocardioides daphniae]GGD25433.1 hypothetical protein GCM10007231_25980 [Nocardioides daphniae]
MTSARRRLPRWLLVLLLLGMPLLELFVLIQVGQVIGAAWTIVLLIVASFVGGWLIRREGAKAWRALTESLQGGRMPTRELADGALIVLAGALMLSPGFVTDAFALLLILPGTRPLARRALTAAVARRVVTPPGGAGFGGAGFGFPGAPSPTPGNARRPGPPTDGQVIRGEVVDP